MKTANYNVRVNPEIKAEAEALYSMWGLNLSQAFNLFLHQSLMKRGLPFELKAAPNIESNEYWDNHPMTPHIKATLLQACEDIDNGTGEWMSVDEVDDMLKETIRRAENAQA
ncbi:MAG: type II toxin-antitoxin system RelB/DinJ family antitoxin [Oscillospiraceae bacterium]|nr:type II toxin-antitoxin system RelB/DinJ family antitoxin [Oscillospiraceae bacterium]